MIRLATLQDKTAVNKIRKQVLKLHANALPDVFQGEFGDALADKFDDFVTDSDCFVAVYEHEGKVVGFTTANVVSRPEGPYTLPCKFMHVQELGVDENHQREGIGSQLLEFVKQRAKQLGLGCIQLDMWSFNDSARAFYKKCGFTTFREFMEIKL